MRVDYTHDQMVLDIQGVTDRTNRVGNIDVDIPRYVRGVFYILSFEDKKDSIKSICIPHTENFEF